MTSLDFEAEKSAFREYYDSNRDTMNAALKSFETLIGSLLASDGKISISKIEGRLKDREECLSKFTRKYRTDLEAEKTEYAIKDHISDLLGLRIVCLYEDELDRINDLLSREFQVLEVTDKSAQMEKTEASFGYKGLHLDLKLNASRESLIEYVTYAGYAFEIQIRTVVQDSWSILDHKIKYKKSIPSNLKRRINTLAALFELADREFRAIRDSTEDEISKEDSAYEEIKAESEQAKAVQNGEGGAPPGQYAPLNAFNFLRIANHFFPTYDFEPHKVDGFTKEIVDLKPGISRGKFNFYLRETISDVKRYQQEVSSAKEKEAFNPYTVIRHCLYAGDSGVFRSMLTDTARDNFERWRTEDGQRAV